MFKKVYFPLLGMLVFLSLLLTGCGCKHEWKDATCEAPKTCTKCNETEGEALGHNMVDASCVTPLICDRCKEVYGNAWGHKFADATCEAPETCIRCPQTQGEALGHTWVDATCTTKKICSVCEKTEGDVLGHDWMEATTDAPKTCRRCQKTEGDRLIDPRFNKEACQDLIGVWAGIITLRDDETGIEGFKGRIELSYTLTFRKDGSYKEIIAIIDKAACTSYLSSSIYSALILEFSQQGINISDAERAIWATYGMSMNAYCKALAETVDWEATYNSITEGVYYVVDGLLYSAESWSAEFGNDAYSVKDSILTIQSLKEQFPSLTIKRGY